MVLGKLDSHTEKTETGSLSYSMHKNHSKWAKDWNLRPKTIKLLEEKTGGKLLDISLGDDLFKNLTRKTKAMEAKINKWNYIKLQSFYIAKETTKPRLTI